jgi:uncharacterized protein YcfJ
VLYSLIAIADMEQLSVREVAVGSGYGAACGAVLGAIFSSYKFKRITLHELRQLLQTRAQRRADQHRTGTELTVEPKRGLPLPYLVKIPEDVLARQHRELLREQVRTSAKFVAYWSLLGAIYVTTRTGLNNYCAHHTAVHEYKRWQIASTLSAALIGTLGGITRLRGGAGLAVTTALGAALGYVQGRATNPHTKREHTDQTPSRVWTVLDWIGVHKLTEEEMKMQHQRQRDKEAAMKKSAALQSQLNECKYICK